MKRTLSISYVALLTACSASTTPSDASTAADSPLVVEPDASHAIRHNGLIRAIQIRGASGSESTIGTAAFGDFDLAEFAATNSDGCAFRSEGDCLIATCESRTLPELVHAGTITIRSADGSTELALDPVRGYGAVLDGSQFAAGTAILVGAAGSRDVPAFDASIVAPPDSAFAIPTSATREGSLTLSWDATVAASEMLIGVTKNGPLAPGSFTQVTCAVPTARGALSIPSATLAEVDASEVMITAAALNAIAVTSGEYAIRIEALRALQGAVAISD